MEHLGSGVLAIDHDRVIQAAGALDALVEAHRADLVLPRGHDAGHPDVTAAVGLFAALWTFGLDHLLSQQTARAVALRRAADDLVGHDVDIAYGFRSALGTL